MLCESQYTEQLRLLRATKKAQVAEEVLMARFAGWVNALGPLSQDSPALRMRLLEEIKTIARFVDSSNETGSRSGYGRRLLCEEPGSWSLAAIILRPGQQTRPHNHDGWGCAVTVQGVERDRRFIHDEAGNLVLSGERDYPLGTGYIFDAADIHQPFGADPRQVTVSLHFLVHGSYHRV
jgi:predicted metal-dependent enzyme (double-stranded beta helix superfamily)